MGTSKLAFLDWVMGQVLLPEQFEAQQEAILANIAARAVLTGLPTHGLARLRLDEELLAGGALQIERLTYVFDSGLMIDVPGNTVIGNFSLDSGLGGPTAIYLHISNEVSDATDLKLYLDDPAGVRRVIYRAELSTAPSRDNARECVKLLDLQRRDDRWSLGAYSPPLLRVGAEVSPFLRDALERSLRAVQAVESQLGRRIKDAFLGSEQGAELRRVRSAAHRVIAALGDHGVGGAEPQQKVALHPYFLYAALREFYMEAATLGDEPVDPSQLRYNHGDPGACFEELRRRVESSVGAGSLSTQRLEFERRASWYVAGPLPDGLRRAKDVFLVVKPGPGGAVNFEGVKLASPRRIEEAYTRALAGVPLTPFKSSSFSHVYGHDAVFYQVGTAGDEEWAHAVRDGDVCFPAWRELDGIHAVLVWGV